MSNQGYSMILFKYRIAFAFVLFTSQAYAFDDALLEKLRALDWHSELGNYQLKDINASVTTSKEEWLLQGKDAHKYMYLTEGHEGFKLDAVIVRVEGPNQDTQVIYTYNEIGYVKTDDWEEHIDKDAMLEEIKKNTEEANKIKAAGYPSLHVDSWAQEPYLNKSNAIVYWAISAHSSAGDSIINAKALKLGRKGFTEIIWMGRAALFSNAETSLSPTLAAYKYDEGAAYADFVPNPSFSTGGADRPAGRMKWTPRPTGLHYKWAR